MAYESARFCDTIILSIDYIHADIRAADLFSDRPHVCLEEAAWDDETLTTTTRYSILDAETAEIAHRGSTMQAYTDAGYRLLLAECGFDDVVFYPSLMGDEDASQAGLFVIAGSQRAAK